MPAWVISDHDEQYIGGQFEDGTVIIAGWHGRRLVYEFLVFKASKRPPGPRDSRLLKKKAPAVLNDSDNFATSSKDLNHPRRIFARSPFTKMSAAQLLNPKAESRVCFEGTYWQTID